ncbi:hypothetical protein [Dyadobacter endophyticus]|nr:hypothetical protein [Dyadobacter endophyticus]
MKTNYRYNANSKEIADVRRIRNINGTISRLDAYEANHRWIKNV